MNQLFFYGGAFDAGVVLLIGLWATALFLVGAKDALDRLWDRVVPAALTLVLTSVAAGIILAAAKWAFLR